MPADGTAHIRIARPSTDLSAAERFWTRGLGLHVLHRHDRAEDAPEGEHSLLMVGWPEAHWHIELTHDPRRPVTPTPTAEDVFVLYLDEPVPDELVSRLEQHGGRRVAAFNSYWDTWGVTIQDPDGYRLVLSSRAWSNS